MSLQGVVDLAGFVAFFEGLSLVWLCHIPPSSARCKHLRASVAIVLVLYKKSLTRFQNATNIALLVTFFQNVTFVIAFFAFADADAELDEAAAGENLKRDDGFALLFGFDEMIDLTLFGEQFAVACLVGLANWNAGCAVDGGVEKPQLAVLHRHICAAQLAVTHA